MAPRQVKDVKGIIKRIVTPPVSKTFTAKKGPNAGKPFTIWSIGIQMDDGEWYNIKTKTAEKAEEYLRCQKLDRKYDVGDEVKIYLEAEDAAGQYWRISSIVPWGPTDEVPVEKVLDEAEALVEKEKEDDGEVTEAEVKKTDEQYHIEPVGTATAKSEPPKETPKPEAKEVPYPPGHNWEGLTPTQVNEAYKKKEEEKKKDQQSPPQATGKVQDYKIKEANKYELGMAKNNATILMAGMLTGKTVEEAKEFIKNGGVYYDNLITSLYNRGKIIREKILGY